MTIDLSIVIICYNDDEYIRKTLESCLNASGYTIEIIVIDNASTDDSRKTIEKVASGSGGSIRLIENPHNLHLGAARNQGIAAAQGRYILFVDGDDWLERDGLPGLIRKSKDLDYDIIMFNMEKVWPDGRTLAITPNRYVALRFHEEDISDHWIRKNSIRNLNTASNKIYRLDFIRSLNIGFDDTYYEDMAWSLMHVMRAKSVYYLPDVIYHYRQRQGSILHSASDRHFEIFSQARRLRDFLVNDEFLKRTYGRMVYGYVRDTMISILNSRQRVPTNREEEFLYAIGAECKAWRRLLSIRDFDFLYYSSLTGKIILFRKAAHLFSKVNARKSSSFNRKMSRLKRQQN